MDHGLNTVQLVENGAPTQPPYKKYFFGTDFCKEGEITVNVSAGVLFSCVGRMVRWKIFDPIETNETVEIMETIAIETTDTIDPIEIITHHDHYP